MKILIDADGCPVVDITVHSAKEFHIPCLIFCDTAHEIVRDGAETVVVSKGADSVDFALVNAVSANDIVITQDYGLAAMCLGKRARVLRQDGMEYTGENMNELLMTRHIVKKVRRSGGRTKGPQKRTRQDDICFETALIHLIKEMSD